jgi:hypothetical protein
MTRSGNVAKKAGKDAAKKNTGPKTKSARAARKKSAGKPKGTRKASKSSPARRRKKGAKK